MTRTLWQTALLVLLSLFASGTARAVDPQSAPAQASPPQSPPSPVPEAKTWVTQHTITVGGAPLAYTATAGPPEVRRNVVVEYYEAGHMMYVHPASRVKFKKDLAGFVDATSR